jgi:hypothetical protein
MTNIDHIIVQRHFLLTYLRLRRNEDRDNESITGLQKPHSSLKLGFSWDVWYLKNNKILLMLAS